jgi:hypothetical protein
MMANRVLLHATQGFEEIRNPEGVIGCLESLSIAARQFVLFLVFVLRSVRALLTRMGRHSEYRSQPLPLNHFSWCLRTCSLKPLRKIRHLHLMLDPDLRDN